MINETALNIARRVYWLKKAELAGIRNNTTVGQVAVTNIGISLTNSLEEKIKEIL